MITKSNWRKYIDRLSDIDKKAADLMQEWINANGLEDGEAAIQYAYALVTKYGEASATLACEMYDYMSEIMEAGVPEAIPAQTATMKEVAKGVTWGKYHSPSQIPSVVSRQVRQAGADTMIQNAKRDHAQWAWVPQGDTCAFCMTLASRGWQDASKTVLKGNHAEHIHQNCDCTFAIAFREKDKRQYDYIYDPDKYLDMYNEAGGDINEMRRQIYAKKRDEYWKKKPEDEKVLTQRLSYNYNGHPEFIPLNTIIENPQAMAGKGTANEIRDVPRLVATYKADESEWKKMSGRVKSEKFIFDIHWYECDDGIVREPKIKYMKERRKQRK